MPDPARFEALGSRDDTVIATRLLADARLAPEREARIAATGAGLIEAIRAGSSGVGGVEDFLRAFSLSSREGMALMVLAEALLRVPDAATADRFIEDRLGHADFAHHDVKSQGLFVNASAWALAVSARLVAADETLGTALGSLARRIGLPALRIAMRQAMQLMGRQFVFGETIAGALALAGSRHDDTARHSFDMLGEGARTAADAERYFDAYAAAITAIGRAAGPEPLPQRPGISVKLSALHPRFEAMNREQVVRDLMPRLLDLARRAKSFDLNFTVDAEEADRLELSLEVIGATLANPALIGWDGFGLAVQAYQKRAEAVIDHVAALAAGLNRRLMVRLVKGAYWDTEIKRAQERGLSDYPVFTRKAMTDLTYDACAARLLQLRPRLFPQFATHNALTVATVLEYADGAADFEFQRLHGMGEALYRRLLTERPELNCRIYAPVGSHRELLAYLVRRLIENGANSSFVALAADRTVPASALLRRPAERLGPAATARQAALPLPRDLYLPQRLNAGGIDVGQRTELEDLVAAVAAKGSAAVAASLIDGRALPGAPRTVVSPIDLASVVGTVMEAPADAPALAMAAAGRGFPLWNATPAARRAAVLRAAADGLEQQRARFIALLQREGGKTLEDAIAEVREAADFCRYYAAEGERLFGKDQPLPGPTGESNVLRLRGRGVIAAISPWNFPLAIFLGQVTAALMAGNAVVAKPAEQTPLIAAEAVGLLHAVGVPASALQLLVGDGGVGAALVALPDLAGVVFTGSTEVARAINRALAAKDGPIVPLIAETGGINAMIVDATALPEQVTDDVMTSAFRSAGQRCSALRLLFVQEDVADGIIDMIVGAAHELRVGDPRDPAVQIGPVIDVDAKQRLDAHLARMTATARILYAGTAPAVGCFVAPHVIALARATELEGEVFGPILHVVRYEAAAFDEVIATIARSGYGLTLGVHSRIDDTVASVVERLQVGNIYVNRNMVGAVVGVQPFGGNGLSGTGPKAGGPHYLTRLALEQTVSINTAAVGGNLALMSAAEGKGPA